MAHPILHMVPRNQRRRLLDLEARRRKAGDWPDWRKTDLPDGAPGTGWLREVRAVHVNDVFSVLERPVAGGVTHLMIASLSQIRPTWWEAQRIKDEIAGDAATAVEVYPPHNEIVDGADAYHLWVLPSPLPFGLKNGDAKPWWRNGMIDSGKMQPDAFSLLLVKDMRARGLSIASIAGIHREKFEWLREIDLA